MEIATAVTPKAFQAYHESTLDLVGAYYDLYLRLGELHLSSSSDLPEITAATPSLELLTKWLDDQTKKIQALSCNLILHLDIEDLLNEIVAEKRGQHIQHGILSTPNQHLFVQNVASTAAVGWQSFKKAAAKKQIILCPQAFLAVESYRQILSTWPTPMQLLDGIEIERRMAMKVIQSQIDGKQAHRNNGVATPQGPLLKGLTAKEFNPLAGEYLKRMRPIFNPASLQPTKGREPYRGRPDAAWVGKIISRIGKAAGVVVNLGNPRSGKPPKYASAHDLRRSCLNRLKDAGVPADVLQSVARHADYRTTQQFYTDTDVQKAAASIRMYPGTVLE